MSRLVIAMLSSRAISTPLEAALVVTLLPPVTARDSVRKLMFSDPESPVTVIADPTATVVADVTIPLALTVI